MTRAMAVRQAGLSIIELMIGITLSLLLILGVTQIFLSSKATYASNQALSSIQESGRFAIEILAKDIRNTGYKGQCLSFPVNHLDAGSSELWAEGNEPIHGWEGSKPSYVSRAIVPNTDVLFIQFAAGATDVTGASSNEAGNDTINLDGGTSPVAVGAVTLISDGLACDLFTNTESGEGAIGKAAGVSWSHDYTDEFEILDFHSLAYYVAVDDDSNRPALFRSRLSHDLSGGSEQVEILVPGVASMNIEYGIASDRIVDSYVDASAVTNWGNVASVKLILDLEAPSGLKKVFSTTVALRNRLP